MLTNNNKNQLTELAKGGDLFARAYVDHENELVLLRQGREGSYIKVRAAGTVDRVLTGLTALDGVTPVAGDLILLKNQTTGGANVTNGIYVAASGAWDRLKDANGNDVIVPSLRVVVMEGGQADTEWQLTNNAPIVVGVDALVFSLVVTSGVSAVDLASHTNGLGASLVGLEDAGSLIVATQVELALQELKTVAKWKAATTLTISGGVVTRTQFLHGVDTEAAAASDDLDTISGGASGDLLLIHASNGAHTVVIKHGTGNIVCPVAADISLAEADDYALLVHEGTNWTVVAFKTLATPAIAIADALNLITATNVEDALQELVKYQTLSLADPGTGVAIPVTRSAYVGLTIGSAGAETNSLAIPTFLGQQMILNADTVGTGTRAVTAAQAINQAGNTIMTFGAARDMIKLEAIKVGGALRWTVMANDGVALS